jgi:hypothetical protein
LKFNRNRESTRQIKPDRKPIIRYNRLRRVFAAIARRKPRRTLMMDYIGERWNLQGRGIRR